MLLMILSPNVIYSHPGGTAWDGCHYCWTNCDYYGYIYGTRHCHPPYAPKKRFCPDEKTKETIIIVHETKYEYTDKYPKDYRNLKHMGHDGVRTITYLIKYDSVANTCFSSERTIISDKITKKPDDTIYEIGTKEEDYSWIWWLLGISAFGIYSYYANKNNN